MTLCYVTSKCSIYWWVWWYKIALSTHLIFAIIQKSSIRSINPIIISKIIKTNISHIDLRSSFIICNKIKIICSFLILFLINTNNTISLIPNTNLLKFIFYNSNWPQIRIIIVNLINRINPSISNHQTWENHSCIINKTSVKINMISQTRNIMTCKWFTCDIEWRIFQWRNLLV